MLNRKFAGVVLTACLVGSLMVGCSSFKRVQIEDLPQEYSAKLSPQYLKTFMQIYKVSDGKYFDHIRITKTGVIADFRQPLGETLLATVTADLIDGPVGKAVDIQVKSENGAYMTLDNDAQNIKRELNLFLVGGR